MLETENIAREESLRVVHVMAALTHPAGGVFPAVRELAVHQARRGLRTSLLGLSDAHRVHDIDDSDGIHSYAGAVLGPRSYGYSLH